MKEPKMNALDLLWGATDIANAIGVSRRRAFYMLENNALPGAKKIAGRWCITQRQLRAVFETEEAT